MPLTPEEIEAAAAAAANEGGGDDDGDDDDEDIEDSNEDDEDDDGDVGDDGGEEFDDDGNPVVKTPKPRVITEAEHTAALATERESARQAVRDEIAAEARAAEAREADRAARDVITNAFPAAEAEVEDTLERLTVRDTEGKAASLAELLQGFTIPNAKGRPVDALAALREYIAGPYRELKDKAIDAGVAIAAQQLEEIAHNLVPADRRKAFIEKYDGAKLETFFKGLVEESAAGTDFLKKLTLAEAEKLSPQIKADLAADRKGTTRAGRQEGRKDPPGDPNPKGGSGARTKSFIALERGYGDGSNTDAEDREYLRQQQAREKAGAAR